VNFRSKILLAATVFALSGGLMACNATPTTEPTAAPEVAVPTEAAAVVEPTEAIEVHTGAHWTYEGAEGPENWGGLSADYEACASGMAQSPIDIAGAAAEDLANIVFDYQPSKIKIQNNGHTVQVDYDPGSSIELDGTRYELAQFHFHAPSEHTIAGKAADAELHLVHKTADGKQLAVVGVLIENGAENPAFATVWENIPAEAGEAQAVAAEVDAEAMLPAELTTYRYDGSLTTPPCTEGVEWNVMTTPIQMSEAQLAAFTALFEGNNRPVQALGERVLVEDSSP
jgi:carbonic anhydrase